MNTAVIDGLGIANAIDLLRQGEVVALPTETVYGLAADAQNDQALKKIFQAKNRPASHPLIVHVSGIEMAKLWVQEFPDSAQILAEKYWPGPLTLVLPKAPWVSNIITGGLDTVAIRVPDSAIMLKIIRELNTGLAAPSANSHKKISPTKAEHVLTTLSGKIPAVIDGGDCKVGIESTIVDLTQAVPTILRPGVITAKMLQDTLQTAVNEPLVHNEQVSGNMRDHYQPEKPLKVMPLKEIKEITGKINNIAVMHHTELARENNNKFFKMPNDYTKYSSMLYKILHEIDMTDADIIVVETPPNTKNWSGITDRLSKASHQGPVTVPARSLCTEII